MKKLSILFTAMMMCVLSFADVVTKEYQFTSEDLPAGCSTTGTLNKSYYKMNAGNYAEITAASLFETEELPSEITLNVACGTFGNWNKPKTITLTAAFYDSDGNVLTTKDFTTDALNSTEGTYRGEFVLKMPDASKVVSKLRITFTTLSGAQKDACARFAKVKVSYQSATPIPQLTANTTALNFGSISMYATAPKKTISVTGKNLTEDITVTLSDKAAFMVDKTTLPAAGGEIVVTPDMEALGENTATLTLKSGEKSVVVSLSSEILLANLISWSVNGKITATTEVIDGEAVVLPATPEVPSTCSAKTFIGWAMESTVNADGTDIKWVTSSTIPTTDVTYYAVFALVAESTKSTTATIDFSEQEYSNGQSFDGIKIAIDDNVSCTFAKAKAQNEPKYYTSGTAIRLYAKGTLTISSVATMSKVEITFSKNDKGKLNKENSLTSNVEKWDNANNIWEGSAKEVVLTEDGTSGNDQFQAISVTYKESTISDYATICNGTTTNIQDAANKAQNIIKTIENGQLVITIDGTRYNAQGQVIE